MAVLRQLLGARGFTEYAVVDHGRDMAAAGHPGHRAWTLIFGNPAAGASLADAFTAALRSLAAAAVAAHEPSTV